MTTTHRISSPALLAPLLLIGCTVAEDPADDDTPDDQPTLAPLPAWVDDCDERLNDEGTAWAGLSNEDEFRVEDVQLCAGDIDLYRVDVPPGRWLSVEVIIDGHGTQVDHTDFDLWELPATGYEDSPSESGIWWSASEESYERLAWYNAGDEVAPHYFAVDPYLTSEGAYDLLVRRSAFDDVRDCDDVYAADDPDYDPEDEDGPCNRILQAPQAVSDDDGYLVSHEAHYSNLRREVLYLVRYAARATRERWPDEPPIGLLDMSERDGSTPGTMVGQLRHPEGTHVEGNDIDIAYYQNGEDNLGRPVCPHDNYFCTGEAEDLDARRTAFFVARLFESRLVRVIGMDPVIAEDVQDAAERLYDDGEIDEDVRSMFYSLIAYGDGWPFHQHHMHLSWEWEGGHERALAPEGCLVGPTLD